MPDIETSAQQQEQKETERTFTQAEVDAIVVKRVATATKGMPKGEELEAFRSWQSTHQTEQDKYRKAQEERDAANTALADANAQLEQMRRERFLLNKGVAADDVDYYAFKIGKLVTDSLTFEAAAEQFLAEKKATAKTNMRVDFSGAIGGQQRTPTANDAMNAIIRGAKK